MDRIEQLTQNIREIAAGARGLVALGYDRDFINNTLDIVLEEPAEPDAEWGENLLRYAHGLTTRFGNTDFGDYSWNEIASGPHGGGRHAYLTFLKARPDLYGRNSILLGRISWALAKIERRA
jgi:hypothetical protein